MRSRLIALTVVLLGVCVLLWSTADWLGKNLHRKPVKRAPAAASAGAVAEGADSGAAPPAPHAGRGAGRFASARQPPASEPTSVAEATVTAIVAEVSSASGTNTSPAALEAEMDTLKLLIRDYRLALGGNPVGSNAEIAKALSGANEKSVKFLPAEGIRLSENGEVIDPWGTPYFFHQISGQEMELRSAGPDGKMWTADDVLLR
jgi:hypothetical protein